MGKDTCKKTPDLIKKETREITDLEELIARSIDNCSLNKDEGRELIKRLRKDKKGINDETKAKLLEVAISGGWNRLAYILDPNYRIKKNPIQVAETKTEIETGESKETKNNLEYLIKSLESEKNELIHGKKWDSLKFWNKSEKETRVEIINQVITILGYLGKNNNLTSKDINSAIKTELSVSIGGVNYNKIREEIKNNILKDYFSGDNFVSDLKQKSVMKIRKNLGGEELKKIFKLEFGLDYTKGMTVPKEKEWLLKSYEDAFDSKDEWTTFSDESKNNTKAFVAYDVSSMVISGGITGAVIKGGGVAVSSAIRGSSILNNTSKISKVATTGVATIATGTTFTGVYEGVRHQEWFLNQDDVVKKIVTNSLMFGTFKFANNMPLKALEYFKSKNPIVAKSIDGLIKQGLIAPALFTMGMIGYDSFSNDVKKEYQDRLKEFILTGILGGTFHLTGVGVVKTIEGLGTKAVLNTSNGEVMIYSALIPEPITITIPKSDLPVLVDEVAIKLKNKGNEISPEKLPEKTKIATAISEVYPVKKESTLPENILNTNKTSKQEVSKPEAQKNMDNEAQKEQLKSALANFEINNRLEINLENILGNKFSGWTVSKNTKNNYEFYYEYKDSSGNIKGELLVISGEENLINTIHEKSRNNELKIEANIPVTKVKDSTVSKPETEVDPKTKIKPELIKEIGNNNYLVDIFNDPKTTIRNGINKTVILEKGALGNVLLFFKQNLQISKIDILYKGKTSTYTFDGKNFNFKGGYNNPEITEESLFTLVEKYKNLLLK